MKLSVVTPIHNERENIAEFYNELTTALLSFYNDYEIVAVDDGSTDGSWTELGKFAQNNPLLRTIRFRTNHGQTAALMAGIHHALGDIIITIDSDLENDPADIVRLIRELESGNHDIVSGWRQDRWKDHGLTRRLPSRVANWLISRITGLPLHDHGCTLKAYKK